VGFRELGTGKVPLCGCRKRFSGGSVRAPGSSRWAGCCRGSAGRSWYYCSVLGYSCLETWVFPVDLYINPVPFQSPASFLLLSPFQSMDSRYAPVLACKSSPKQLLSISRNSACGCREPSSIQLCWCTSAWSCTLRDPLDGARSQEGRVRDGALHATPSNAWSPMLGMENIVVGVHVTVLLFSLCIGVAFRFRGPRFSSGCKELAGGGSA